MSTIDVTRAYFPAATQRTPAHAARCCCPVCLGIECLDRPRFFAGQLLSEADLNSAQAYVMAKNRLHNRYLHGPGVVCGLEVVCNDCDGYVTVKPGYAIDPCGNDIVVCQEQSFDVIGALRKCSQEQKRQQRANCQPYTPAPDPGCKDVEEHYCLTIAYNEVETRPITPLRQDKTSTCGCGCGGSGNGSSKSGGCGCKGQSSSSSAQTSATPASPSQGLAACEPTRTLESFQLGVVPEPANRCGTLAEALQATLLYHIVNCVKGTFTFLGKRLAKTDQSVLFSVLLENANNPGGANVSAADVQSACCRLRQAVIDLYTQNPFNVRCATLSTIDQIMCMFQSSQPNPGFYPSHEPTPSVGNANYGATSAATLSQLVGLLLQYMLDCICHQLLPPCSPDPNDDRLILACVTVRNCKIVDICNFACRRFAGGFPSMNYWLSIIPIIPVLAYLVKTVCCRPDMVRANSPLVNELEAFLAVADPNGSLRQSFAAGNFALPKMYAGAIENLRSRFTVANVASSIKAQGTNLATMVGQSPEQVLGALKASGVNTVEQTVSSADQVPVMNSLTSSPFAASGDTVVVYRTATAVVGFGRAGAQEQVAAKQVDIENLRSQVANLQKEVELLKKK
jgi:hypothetical protein